MIIDKVEFKTMCSKWRKGYFIILKATAHSEDIKIISICALGCTELTACHRKHRTGKKKCTETHEDRRSGQVPIVGPFPLAALDGWRQQPSSMANTSPPYSFCRGTGQWQERRQRCACISNFVPLK